MKKEDFGECHQTMRNEGDHISDLATSRRYVLTQLARSLQTRTYRRGGGGGGIGREQESELLA